MGAVEQLNLLKPASSVKSIRTLRVYLISFSAKPRYAGALACFASAKSFLQGQAGEGACVPRVGIVSGRRLVT
jgi:hypothetical protein